MLRFIIKCQESNNDIGIQNTRLYTIDCDVAELEQALRRGGFSENGYEIHDLVGVEVIDSSCSQNKTKSVDFTDNEDLPF